MATSNRDRVGRALELLGEGLDGFIDSTLGPELQGAKWTALLAAVDSNRGSGVAAGYEPKDPQCGLRMITENIPHRARPGWYPFRDILSRPQEALASELREVRNSWAHNRPITTDDAYRALDTTERLLRVIGAVAAADETRRLRVDLRQVTTHQEDRRARVAIGADVAGSGLPAWREVLAPHPDVASGNFHAAEFAADLSMVMRGEGDPEYTDPVEFFRRTYLTAGLRDLIGRASRRLSGDLNTSPVVNLQTNFGGGKTHSMLALWHLAAGRRIAAFPQDLQEVADVRLLDDVPGIRRAAIVGNHIPSNAAMRKPDGTVVRTIWGELAWQLGGAEGYAIVASSDESATSPGDQLRELFKRYSPALILIDEWVAYARQLYGEGRLLAGSFETQFTFAQTLTEMAKAVPGVLVVISVPASSEDAEPDARRSNDEETGGPNGQEALRRLQNVVRRVADHWQPASSEESFEIVRRRLFASPDGEQLAQISAIAHEMVTYYQRYSAEFPSEASDPRYADRIKRAYPIHPELFDRLYEDWSTLDRFQRTRGVLRLMNTVVGALWRSGDAAPLILPGSVPLEVDAVSAELAQYLEDRWKAVIDADVAGSSSTPATVDNENRLLGKRSTTQRLARAVFMGATPALRTAHRGVTRKQVFLGTALPGDVPGNFYSALTHLANTATYFYIDGDRSWYDTQANTTRAAQDFAAQLHPEDVWKEIDRRLQAYRRGRPEGFAAVHIAPASSAEVPDLPEARLVVVPPQYTYDKKLRRDAPAVKWVADVLQHRGTAARTHRNSLVFLALDDARGAELDGAVREFLAWDHIQGNRERLDLTQQQWAQADVRAKTADRTTTDRLVGGYHWALLPDQPDPTSPWTVEAIKAEGSDTDIVARTAKKLVTESALSVVRATSLMRMDLDAVLARVWEPGHISLGELWALYTTYPYLARLRDRSVIEDAVRSLEREMFWEQTGFALAVGYDGDRYNGLWLKGDEQDMPALTDAVLLVKPSAAVAQRDAEMAARPPAPGPTPGSDPQGPAGPAPLRAPTGPARPEPPAPPLRPTRYFGSAALDPQFYVRDFNRLAAEILQHLAAAEGVELEVRVEIHAVSRPGFDERQVRTVRENATVLKLDPNQFEAE